MGNQKKTLASFVIARNTILDRHERWRRSNRIRFDGCAFFEKVLNAGTFF
jgi:DNA-directed RNA polymerase specialized sigma24 family protein